MQRRVNVERKMIYMGKKKHVEYCVLVARRNLITATKANEHIKHDAPKKQYIYGRFRVLNVRGCRGDTTRIRRPFAQQPEQRDCYYPGRARAAT